MKNICLVNGSPRDKEAVSLYFLNILDNIIDEEKYNKNFISVKASANKENFEEEFNKLADSDILIISFPLYFYCLPGLLIGFLEEYYNYIKNKKELKKDVMVYAIINCGFPEAEINNEAIRVMQNFCNRLNYNWRCAVSISCGPMISGMKNIHIIKNLSWNIKNSLKKLADNIESNGLDAIDNILVKPKLPKTLILKGATLWFTSSSKKNGLIKKDMYKRPYIG